MTDDYDRFLDLLCAAQELDSTEVGAFLDSKCADSPELRTEIERHLPSTDTAERLAARALPAFEAAACGGVETGRETSTPALAPGSKLDNFRILEVIGEGGMGIVYLAEQTEPVRRRVAVKAIKPGLDTREVLARFDAERQALALMSHPSIAQVYDAGFTDAGHSYFVMEYVAGESITRFCDRCKLDMRRRAELFVQVCHGVQHAHQKDVLHRDLKPSNVLVTGTPERPIVKIIDFGVAKATSRPLAVSGPALHTALGQAIGTPAYMSPEHVGATSHPSDARSDIFSLGVLLYELLTGELPHNWESPPPRRPSLTQASTPSSGRMSAYEDILRRIRDDVPPVPSQRWARLDAKRRRTLAANRGTVPSEVARELRGELDWITAKAMEKEPHRRYRDAAELAADVERHLRGEPVMAGPPGRWYRWKRFATRHRAVLAAALAVTLSLAAGLAASLVLYLEARRQANQVLRLSDVKALLEYQRTADTLWPAAPELIPRLEEWLAQARRLTARRAAHQATLEKLRARGTLQTEGGITRWVFADTETLWWHDTLAKLVNDLEAFAAPDSAAAGNTIASVERRLQFARSVRQASLVDAKPAWDAAIASISNRRECPLYDGLTIVPQLGLVPIGRDPRSGLWEFAHLQTGTPAKRAPGGELQLSDETGLVFVLIPGGTFWMGAARPGKRQTLREGRADPHAEAKEEPVHEVTLAPFFLSKYEMTQAQWERFNGKNPSGFGPDRTMGGHRHSGRHPVENVSWQMCRDVMERLGLTLPTEAQWEYAASAGRTTIWWPGNDEQDLADVANLADRYCREHGGPASWQYEKWSDGYMCHAPAGTFSPNAFGLHEIHGNVREWCRDGYATYDRPVAAGDGERRPEGEVRRRMIRGGSFDTTAVESRLSTRTHGTAVVRSVNLGVRPARPLAASPGETGRRPKPDKDLQLDRVSHSDTMNPGDR